MNHRRHTSFYRALVAAAVVATICPLQATAPVAASAPLQQRIDALLKRRLRPEPLPINPPNPFQLNGGVIHDLTSDEATVKTIAKEEVDAGAEGGDQDQIFRANDQR